MLSKNVTIRSSCIALAFVLIGSGNSLSQLDPKAIIEYNRSFGARLDFEYSVRSEMFVSDLVSKYGDYCSHPPRQPQLDDELIFAWIDALLGGNHCDKERILTLIRSTPQSSFDTKLIGFMALDELDAVAEIIECLKREDPQVQYFVVTDIVSRSKKFDHLAGEIVAAVNRDAIVLKSTGQYSHRESFRVCLDEYLLLAARRSGKVASPHLIANKTFRAAAMSFLGQLSPDETAKWMKAVLADDIAEKPPCVVCLDFANDESSAARIFDACKVDCDLIIGDMLIANNARFPRLVNKELVRLANSKKISENITVLAVHGGGHLGVSFDSPSTLVAVLNGLQATEPSEYRDLLCWPLTFGACKRIDNRIRIRDEVLKALPEYKCDVLRRIAEEAEEYCPSTFFCLDLREAIKGFK